MEVMMKKMSIIVPMLHWLCNLLLVVNCSSWLENFHFFFSFLARSASFAEIDWISLLHKVSV